MDRTTAILIPARYASTRLPGKPLIPLMGLPMIHHVVAACLNAFEERLPVFVATDDERIAETATKAGAQAIMTPAECANGTVRILSALRYLSQKGRNFDTILHIQGDEPLIDRSMLRSLFALVQNPGVELATLAAPITDTTDPNTVKAVFTSTGRALYFSRQPIPSPGRPGFGHIGLYGWSRQALDIYNDLPAGVLEAAENLEQLRWLENGRDIHVAVVENMPVGVNVPEDVATVERLLLQREKP